MGYTTKFRGTFTLDRPLTVEHMAALSAFADRRHNDAVMPSHYCQWTPTADGTGIEWDGGEKFYDYTEWLAYIVEHFLRPWGYTLNGSVKWQGEDMDDRGVLIVEDNCVRAEATP